MRSAIGRIPREGEGAPRVYRFALCQYLVVVADVFHAGWHDAHYGERLCFQRDFPAENIRVGMEAALPQAIAEDDLAVIAGQFVFDFELAPQCGIQSEQMKE